MDTETVERAETVVSEIAADHGVTVDRLIVFGSRARDDYRDDSDIDLILVSPDFASMAYHERTAPFYREWPYGELPDPEFICLTPDEFAAKKERKPHIVRTAVEEGVSLA